MKETHPTGNLISKDFYRTKKLVLELGLTAEKKLIVVLMVVCYFTLMKKMQLKECKFFHKPCF